jgi:hypothetical protein
MAKTDDGWDIVSEDFPTRVQFEDIGDEFIGTFQKAEKVDGREGPFTLYLFTDGSVNGVEGQEGERFSVGDNSRIKTGMKRARPGNQVRIRYVADIPTNQENPMKDYEIAIRR